MITTSQIRAATDVGGTFTDFACFFTDHVTGERRLVTAKSDTTPPDYEQGVMDVLAKSEVVLAEIGVLAHGTTVVINVLTERKGAVTGLITTTGFRDSLEIARGNRPDFFNLDYVKPPPFVPRDLRREVPGRLTHDGHERAPVELDGLPEIIGQFQTAGVEAVAVCLLHAYANPAHERAVLERVRELWPSVAVVASHEITREWREYERANTTVLSAYVQPLTERYLTRLADVIDDRGYNGQLYIMQSNCGVDSVEHARRVPITMVESGPASGVLGAAELGKLTGDLNILALDIGGTTAKCSLIQNGEVQIVTDYWIERSRESAGYPIMVPVVDLVEIGAGGGSIATVDEHGRLRVGPQSAGAKPGPAAYGRGGTQLTTTDANLALGRINPGYFCGGEIQADMTAVGHALDSLADRLGCNGIEAARGVIRIANNAMINALKLVSLNRGHDPRDFVLVAFGGGGGMHAVALAAELGIRKVLIPRSADVFSAWGMLMGNLRRDVVLTRLVPLAATHTGALEALLLEADDLACEQYAQEGIAADDIQLSRYARLRYENQEHTVEVPLPQEPVDVASVRQILTAFHDLYEREYTYRLDAAVELVGVHLVAIADIGTLSPTGPPITGRRLAEAVKGARVVDYADDGVHEALILNGELLEPGMDFAGPAVVETPGSTTVVHPSNSVVVDRLGNLVITLADQTLPTRRTSDGA